MIDHNVTIIGFHGKARSGKDSAAGLLADILEREFPKARAMVKPLATPIKDMLHTLLLKTNWSKEDGGLVEINDYVHGDRKDEPLPWLGVSARQMLQTLGTEWGRGMISEDLWLTLLERRIKAAQEWVYPEAHHLFVIVPDIRYENEAEMCDRLFHMIRPDQEEIPLSNHLSETGLTTFFDARIYNDGSLSDLEDALEHLCKEMGWHEQSRLVS